MPLFLLQTIKVVKKVVMLYAAFIGYKKAYDTADKDLLLLRLKVLKINGIFLQNIGLYSVQSWTFTPTSLVLCYLTFI